jgi:NAD(P)H-quinone oxidoreductase subunit 4L
VIGLNHYLVLSAILFCIGLFGALTRRNTIAVLIFIELMLNAANLALVAFSRFITPAALTGQVFAIFVMVVAAAEASIGLAIIITLYRQRQHVDTDAAREMKG